MNGIYIHIPFCRKACRYCDFFFTISIKHKEEFLDALKRELLSERRFDSEEAVSSIYIGGGTPSVLTSGELNEILELIYNNYSIASEAEITMEANPDDLNRTYLEEIKKAGINRLSIGIQSFDDASLDLMRRSHDAKKAIEAVRNAAETGIKNLNCDLIYGLPDMTEVQWEKNLEQLFLLPVKHLSAYHLTFEPGTVFDHWRKKGRISVPREEDSIRQYSILRLLAQEKGFEHYEISNFAREESYSRHNLLYWTGGKYLGFGPSAHSYDGISRSWNIPSIDKYIRGVGSGEILEREILTEKDCYHDYLITSMRTKWGVDPFYIQSVFSSVIFEWFKKASAPFIKRGDLLEEEGKIKMTGNSWFVADHILRELFID